MGFSWRKHAASLRLTVQIEPGPIEIYFVENEPELSK